ncbi:hypothetical protein CDAR_434271 [Caerostris darwini]|uniref:Uncharacterized protein n=1 Tax=Caerostris darwini TaxID=1538125 RepID=A0AAV4UA43_9ARAC|nr:hypothetical protein CDAR_434271 [Caerostris darwini]
MDKNVHPLSTTPWSTPLKKGEALSILQMRRNPIFCQPSAGTVACCHATDPPPFFFFLKRTSLRLRGGSVQTIVEERQQPHQQQDRKFSNVSSFLMKSEIED